MTLTPLMLFAGGRAGDFTVVTGGLFETNGVGWYDPAYADCTLGLNAATLVTGGFTNAAGAPTSVPAGKTAAMRVSIGGSRGIVAGAILTLNDLAGYPWVRVFAPFNGGMILQYNSGTGASPAWTNLGSVVTVGSGGLVNVSVLIDAGGNHSALFAFGGSTVFVGGFSNAGLTNLAGFAILNTDPSGNMFLSEVMAAQDLNLVGARLKTLRATGAGAHSDWTGTYADVNEVTSSDANSNKAASSGLSQSYAMTDVTVPIGYSIRGVFYSLRTKNGGFGVPANIKALARSGGSDFISGPLSGVNAAYGYSAARYDVDPATGVAWTQAGVNALELGFQSAN